MKITLACPTCTNVWTPRAASRECPTCGGAGMQVWHHDREQVGVTQRLYNLFSGSRARV